MKSEQVKIKFCGLRSEADIGYVNELLPDYIGFVFAKNSKRYVTPELAFRLKMELDERIVAVGVFVDEEVENVISLLNDRVVDMAQLHGNEDDEYIMRLKVMTDAPVIKAFKIKKVDDVRKAESCVADYLLLDSGEGSGENFDWSLLEGIKREFFLAGGLNERNVREAIDLISPMAVDVSSGIETGGRKDFEKMKAFYNEVRRDA